MAVMYIRRLNVLSTLAGHKDAKQMLKDNSDLLAEENSDNELFGGDFRKHLMDLKKEEETGHAICSSEGSKNTVCDRRRPKFK